MLKLPSLIAPKVSATDWRVSMERQGSKKAHEVVLRVCALVLLLQVAFPGIDLHGGVVAAATLGGLHPDSVYPCRSSDPMMDPTHEVRYGQDTVWQIPPRPRAVLFMAHGRDFSPFSFFDAGLGCPMCFGLPEDRTVVLDALKLGYAVIAVKSIEDTFEFWPVEESRDLEIVSDILNEWRAEHSLENLPLMAWGHSGGGLFVSVLTLKFDFGAIVLMCSEGQNDTIDNATPATFPPTFFAYMPMDADVPEFGISTRCLMQKEKLAERGVWVASQAIWPQRMFPTYFAERTLCLSDEMSANIYAAYKAKRWVNNEGYLTKSMAENAPYELPLLESKALPFCVKQDHLCLTYHIQQELRAAEAVHSLTSAANEEIFAFLESSILSAQRAVNPGVNVM